MVEKKTRIKIAEAFRPLLQSGKRFKVYYGGRGAGKSYSFALCLLLLASQKTVKILCAREFQSSMKDSVHALLKQIIRQYELPYFEITEAEIRNTATGSSFIFKGLKRDIDSIKSTQGITHCWVEEAEKVSKTSWDDLIPTIREEGSEIWVSFNPKEKRNETYQRFIANKSDDVLAVKVNYYDNPFISSTLLAEMERAKQTRSRDDFKHIWLGYPMEISEAVVFKGQYRVLDFETPDVSELFQQRFFFGADWGFAQDPNVLIRCFIKDDCLYIDYEATDRNYINKDAVYIIDPNSKPCKLENLKDLFDRVPESRNYKIYGDSSRPETINLLKRQGFDIDSVKKTSRKKNDEKGTTEGYVKDGVEYIKSFKEIIIHERCKNTIVEFDHYCYKQDKTTDEIMPKLEDKYNHIIDSIRYALSTYIRKTPEKKIISFDF